jgi:hypothetical protein
MKLDSYEKVAQEMADSNRAIHHGVTFYYDRDASELRFVEWAPAASERPLVRSDVAEWLMQQADGWANADTSYFDALRVKEDLTSRLQKEAMNG